MAIIRASLHDFLPPAPAVRRLARAVRERVRPRPIDWPVKSREIVQFTLDSTLWNDFRFRDDDIVIATWSKSGTTLTQQIVAQLIFGGRDRFGIVHSPWIESRIVPGARELADQQRHRRFLKTHLPIDALVFSPQAKYIYIGRDARDVCWSWYHQLANWNESAYELIDRLPGRDGPPFGPPDPDIRRFYHDWLDNDAYPNVPFWSHVQGWWNVRNLPNVLLLHFSELTSDLSCQMCRIARFLEIRVSRRRFSQMVEHCGLEHMKRQAAALEGLNERFKHSGGDFINKGTNGRWRDVLSPDEIAKCDAIAAKRLTPDCARWLATGIRRD